MPRIPLGYQAKAYINTATSGTPTWTEVDIIRNVTLNLEKGEADVTTRGAQGWKEVLPTLKEASIDTELVWDTTQTIVLDIKDWRENHRLSLQSFKKFGRSFLFLLITFVASRTCCMTCF